jgi:hypothetical protein
MAVEQAPVRAAMAPNIAHGMRLKGLTTAIRKIAPGRPVAPAMSAP